MPNIKCNDSELNICHDINGNVYLIDNGVLYLVFIEGNNVLTLMRVNTLNYENNVKTKRGKISNNNNKYQLKTKIIDDLIEDAEDDEIENEDEHDVIKTYVYKPEDKYYDVNNDNSDNENDAHDEVYNDPYFKFFGFCDDAPIKMDISVYDTIILTGGLSSHNVTFKSELMNDSQSYRISIYTDGYIKLNIIGSTIKTYRITKGDSVALTSMNESIVVSKY